MDRENESSDDDDDDKDEDIVMKEASTEVIIPTNEVLPIIRARLELLYDSVRVNNLLYRVMQLATSANSNEVTQSISSFFNTLMLRWPMKKDAILNTLLYKETNTQHLLQILWNSWSNSDVVVIFKQEGILSHLVESTKSITGICTMGVVKDIFF